MIRPTQPFSDATKNLYNAEKQTRNKKIYYANPVKEKIKPKANKPGEALGGKSSLKKRELKNLQKIFSSRGHQTYSGEK